MDYPNRTSCALYQHGLITLLHMSWLRAPIPASQRWDWTPPIFLNATGQRSPHTPNAPGPPVTADLAAKGGGVERWKGGTPSPKVCRVHQGLHQGSAYLDDPAETLLGFDVASWTELGWDRCVYTASSPSPQHL